MMCSLFSARKEEPCTKEMKQMKDTMMRITLVTIELFVGLWAVIGGVGLVTRAIP